MSDPKVFSLRDRGLKLDDEADIQALLKEIEHLSAVEVVDLSGNSFGLEASQALGNILKDMPKLKTANLGNIFTTRANDSIPPALTAICDALITRPALKHVDLNGNAIGAHATRLVPLITSSRSLRSLNLENLGLSPESGTIVANGLHQSAKSFTQAGTRSNLRTFCGGRNRLENGSAPAWGEAFAAHGTLVNVDLRRACLRGAGFTAIVEGLAKCSGLRFLNMDDNIGANDESPDEPAVEGWPTFATALRGWTELRFLNVGNCLLDPERFKLLLDVLRAGHHTHLNTLILDNSDLTEEIYDELLEIIPKKLPALKVLSLAGNEDLEDAESIKEIERIIGERGGEVILEEPDDGSDREWPVPIEDEDEVSEKGAVVISADDELEAQLAKLTIKS